MGNPEADAGPGRREGKALDKFPAGWEHQALTLRAGLPDGVNEMMYDPPHPGEVLREDVIVPLGLSVTEAAKRLAMSRAAFLQVLNCRAGLSPDLALRLEQAGVSTARAWLAMQASYDLWQTMRRYSPQ